MANAQRALRRRTAREQVKERSIDPEFLQRVQAQEVGESTNALFKSLKRAEAEIASTEEKVLQLLTVNREIEAERDAGDAEVDLCLDLIQRLADEFDEGEAEDLVTEARALIDTLTEEIEEVSEATPEDELKAAKKKRRKAAAG